MIKMLVRLQHLKMNPVITCVTLDHTAFYTVIMKGRCVLWLTFTFDGLFFCHFDDWLGKKKRPLKWTYKIYEYNNCIFLCVNLVWCLTPSLDYSLIHWDVYLFNTFSIILVKQHHYGHWRPINALFYEQHLSSSNQGGLCSSGGLHWQLQCWCSGTL